MATSTRTLIERMHRKKPSITSPEIAARLGISRQRVHALAQRMGITLTKVVRPKEKLGPCSVCGKPLTYAGTKTHLRCHYVSLKCAGCGIRFKRTRTATRAKRHYHSRECFEKAHWKAKR